MVYYGTDAVEYIVFHAAGESNDKHYIEMTKHADMPVFTVSYCCDPEWSYDFLMNGNSDYERVKYNIMTAIFNCEDVDALFVVLNEVFKDGFSDILIKADKCNCDGSCENCTCKD